MFEFREERRLGDSLVGKQVFGGKWTIHDVAETCMCDGGRSCPIIGGQHDMGAARAWEIHRKRLAGGWDWEEGGQLKEGASLA